MWQHSDSTFAVTSSPSFRSKFQASFLCLKLKFQQRETRVSSLETNGFKQLELEFQAYGTKVPSHETNGLKVWNECFPMTKKYEAIQVVIFRKEKRKRRKNRGRTCDSKSTVTVLSHVAVTPLLIHCQKFKYKHVTDDSKFSLFNSLVNARWDYISAYFFMTWLISKPYRNEGMK